MEQIFEVGQTQRETRQKHIWTGERAITASCKQPKEISADGQAGNWISGVQLFCQSLQAPRWIESRLLTVLTGGSLSEHTLSAETVLRQLSGVSSNWLSICQTVPLYVLYVLWCLSIAINSNCQEITDRAVRRCQIVYQSRLSIRGFHSVRLS